MFIKMGINKRTINDAYNCINKRHYNMLLICVIKEGNIMIIKYVIIM